MTNIPSLEKLELYITTIAKKLRELHNENKRLRKANENLMQKLKKAEELAQLSDFDSLEIKKIKQENADLKKHKQEARQKVEEMLSKFEELEL